MKRQRKTTTQLQIIKHFATDKSSLPNVPAIKKPAKKMPKRRSTKNVMAEKELERKIMSELKQIGCIVYKTGASGAYDYNQQFNDDGFTDLIVLKGIFGFLMEVKPPSKRGHKDGGLTKKQPVFRDRCLLLGIKHYVVYSADEALKIVENITCI